LGREFKRKLRSSRGSGGPKYGEQNAGEVQDRRSGGTASDKERARRARGVKLKRQEGGREKNTMRPGKPGHVEAGSKNAIFRTVIGRTDTPKRGVSPKKRAALSSFKK